VLGIVIHFGPKWDTTPSFPDTHEPLVAQCPERQIEADSVVLTTRSWLTYPTRQHYCTDYTTSEEAFDESHNFRLNYSNFWSVDNLGYWGSLYKTIFEREKEQLAPIVDSLLNIKRMNQLSRTDFAEVVVAFVQDIPYSYIKVGDECDSRDDPRLDCVPNQKFGLLTPIEFLHTLKGDCDTRTLLLYTIFKQLGYSPKIANSEVYLHSMLLLDVPSSGHYLTENNQRYYFWETTVKGWHAGDLPPEYGNEKYWEIVLN
jgi:hypothetical protein